MYGSAKVMNTDESVSGMNRPQLPSTGVSRLSQTKHSRSHGTSIPHSPANIWSWFSKLIPGICRAIPLCCFATFCSALASAL